MYGSFHHPVKVDGACEELKDSHQDLTKLVGPDDANDQNSLILPTNDIVAERMEWVRYRIGFYGSTPAYWPVLESAGFPNLGKKLNIMTKEGKWDKLAAAVPDDLLHACTIIGRHQEIKRLIADYYGGLSDTLLASQSYEQPSDLPPDLISELREIETPFKKFSTTRSLTYCHNNIFHYKSYR